MEMELELDAYSKNLDVLSQSLILQLLGFVLRLD